MTCFACTKEIKTSAHNTMTNILFHTCECGEVCALEKGKIRPLKPNEKAFLRALQVA